MVVIEKMHQTYLKHSHVITLKNREKKKFPITQETLSDGGGSPARACEAEVLPVVRRVHEGGMGDGGDKEMGDGRRWRSGFHNCNGSPTASHPMSCWVPGRISWSQVAISSTRSEKFSGRRMLKECYMDTDEVFLI